MGLQKVVCSVNVLGKQVNSPLEFATPQLALKKTKTTQKHRGGNTRRKTKTTQKHRGENTRRINTWSYQVLLYSVRPLHETHTRAHTTHVPWWLGGRGCCQAVLQTLVDVLLICGAGISRHLHIFFSRHLHIDFWLQKDGLFYLKKYIGGPWGVGWRGSLVRLKRKQGHVQLVRR